MSKPFCGACIRDIPPGDAWHELDGVRICSACAEDAPIAVDADRGYDAPGGVGVQFMRKVAEVHDAIVPRAVVELDWAIPFGAPKADLLPDKNTPNLVKGCKVRR